MSDHNTANLAIGDQTSVRALNLLRRAVNENWNVSQQIKDDAVAACHQIIKDNRDPRAVTAACKFLAAAEAGNVTAAKALHEAERLEEGKSTSNVDMNTPDLRAIARALAGRPDVDDIIKQLTNQATPSVEGQK